MCGLVRGYELRLAVLIALLSLSATYTGMAAASDFAKAPSWIAPDESIVVLESPQFHFDWDHRRLPLRIDLFHCATRVLHAKYPGVRLITQKEFVKQAFPDLEPNLAPISPESLKLLAKDATLKARIAPLNLRYLVYGGTENDIETVYEGFGCIGGDGAAFCGGGGEWKKRSSYQALVFDVKTWRDSASAGAATGTSWFATILPLFVGWKSPTETRTCTALGQAVLELLEGVPPAAAAEERKRP